MSDKESNVHYTGASAGEVLRSARESSGYSIDEAASRLCLSVHYIESIERDDYSVFAARAYARGYVLSYARFLEISEVQILPAFTHVAAQFDLNKNTIVNAASLRTENAVPIYQDDDRQPHSNFIWWVSAFIILLLAGLVVMWAQGPHGSDKNPANNMENSVSSTAMPLQPDNEASNANNNANSGSSAGPQTQAPAPAQQTQQQAPVQQVPAQQSSAPNNANDGARPAPQRSADASANNNVSLPAPQQTADD